MTGEFPRNLKKMYLISFLSSVSWLENGSWPLATLMSCCRRGTEPFCWICGMPTRVPTAYGKLDFRLLKTFLMPLRIKFLNFLVALLWTGFSHAVKSWLNSKFLLNLHFRMLSRVQQILCSEHPDWNEICVLLLLIC